MTAQVHRAAALPRRQAALAMAMIVSGLLLEGRDAAIADWGICHRAVAERA